MNSKRVNVKETLLAFKKNFDPKLASFFNAKLSQIKKIDPKLAPLVEQIKDLILRGGKRLRPAFLYYGFKACGGKDERKTTPFCLAVELGHSMALIHDDIMDTADLRRGGPAVNKILGVNGAILAGDLCFSWAEELFRGGPGRYWDLLKEEVILGQYLDTTLSSKELIKEDLKEPEQKVLKVLEYKTARYSVVRPLQIGALLAGAKEKELKIFANYGVPLGIAFQIVDDILGVFGDEKTVGKPVSSDLREGKITLLTVKTLKEIEKLGNKEIKKKKLLGLLGNQKATRDDLEWVRGLIRETGALGYCQDKARKLARKAKRAIKDHPFEKEAKKFLLEIADFVIEREF